MTARGHAVGNRLSIAVRLRPQTFLAIAEAARRNMRTVSGEIAWRIEKQIENEQARARSAGSSTTATAQE